MPDKWDKYVVSATPASQPADKWEQYAVPASGADQTPPEPSLLSQVGTQAKEFGKGLLKGAGSTISSADEWSRKHLPAFMTNTAMGFGKPEDIPAWKQTLAPTNTAQSIGKGVEQAGEFLLPGLGEETAATSAAKLVPFAGRAAKPVARLLYNAGTTGLINKAQGGNFGTGAALGAGGSAVAEGARLIAPQVAESALNIRKLDRAYGKNPGRAILDETQGFTPSAVAESAQRKLNELNPQLNAAADRASTIARPRNAGLLQAPTREVQTAPFTTPDVRGELLSARPMPQGNIVGGTSPRVEAELGSQAHAIPARLQRNAFLTGSEQSAADLPRSGPATLITRNPMAGNVYPVDEFGRIMPPEQSGFVARPTTQPNKIASLAPARRVLSGALGTASRQGERTTLNQIQPMATHLGETITGEPIPEFVTPRQLLDLKRGFGNEFIHRWNPETMEGVKGTAARTYHEMSQEFNRTVPEAQELNRRISNLIPVAKRAESAELNAPTSQRLFHRAGAHTGALASGLFGGYQGYERHGLPGAIAGGAAGFLAPELITSPTGEMFVARTLNNPTQFIRGTTGSLLQLPKPDNKNSTY